ncbi:helix-turn-helix domain-containing protein, partial [Mycobacterium sp.]
MVGYRAVHPLAARALFGMPTAELSAIDFDASAVLGGRGIELWGRVAEMRHWQDAFTLIADYLVDERQRRDRATVRPEVAHAWHLLERSRGRAPVSAVADAVGVSARHLTTLFHGEVGWSPKTVAMLIRFERTTARIAQSAAHRGSVDPTAVALDTGHSDQAHLTREFIRFAAVPPRRWLAEEFRNIQDGGQLSATYCEHDPVETDPVETDPVETDPVETDPVET